MEKNAERTQHKRRNYFIDKKFQTDFILRFCAIVILGAAATTGLLYMLTLNTSTVAIANSRVVVKTTADFILPILLQTILVVLIAVSLATIAVTVFFSHRIAGPLYRFKKVIEILSEGNFTDGFRIRKTDQLQDLAKTLNDMIEKTRVELKSLEASATAFKENMGDITEGDVADSKRLSLRELKKAGEEIDRIIRRFKV
jgi:signal transduction histidine kinase